MRTTLGGCLATNIHGKNNFQVGPIGEHVVEFTAMTPTGALVTCTPNKNADLFYAMISGLGMLSVFTSITLKMKRIYSGLISVDAWHVPNLSGQLSGLLEHAQQMAAHESPRTTKLYDRRNGKVTLDEVERIVL